VIEILPGFIEIVILIFCLIDCIQTDSTLVRNLPKIAWIVLIVVLPLVGGIAWLFAGRPLRGAQGSSVPWRATETAGFPEYERQASSRSLDEVDERLRRDQARVDREHEEALRRWEASLRERERKLDPPDNPA
jgi:Phospholipase_D-nuclease N-terminal